MDRNDVDQSGLDLLGCDTVGHGGGGGGHGGGGHGGHGGHGHGGGRGRGRGRGGPWYGGPWGWGDDGYYVDGFYDDDLTAEEIADRVARKLKKKDVKVGYVPPESHWYSIATPGDMIDEMNKIQREADTLDKDVDGYTGGDANFPTFRSAWKAFLAEYKKFYSDNEGWFSRLSSGTGDRIVSYGNQLNDWRIKLKGFSGAKVTEPSVTAIQVREDPNKVNYKPFLIGGLVILGLFGGGFALSKLALFKKHAA